MASINWSADELAAFTALVHTRHFTRAAERCHLSQSAFSQKIRRLEASVGTRLFERSTRQVSLTPEGEVLAHEVLRLDREWQQALGQLKDLAGLRAGRVAVAALPSIAAVWMPGLMADWRRQHPQVRLSLFDGLAHQGLALLREGRVDLALTAGGDLREFDTELLCVEGYWAVVPADHPQAGARSLRLADLAGQDFIHLARSSSVRQQLDRLPQAQGLQASPLEVEHLATLAALVRAGLGVTVVPALTRFHFQGPGLALVPLDEPALARQIVRARRKGQALSVAAQAFEQHLRERLPLFSAGVCFP